MVTQDSQYAIETFSLTKIFPDWWGRSRVIAVDNLDLGIRHNEVYGLLGPNGSGKTTTLKMLLGLLHPTKGNTLVLGGSSADKKISSRIGYLPEDSYLYKYLSARETLDFYGRIFGLSAKIRKNRIDTLLEMVGLSGMANRQVGTYSKGMARRIGLAQALINDPDLLILDEPTSGMDPIGTRQMKDLFRQLARRGKTILLCSHLLADVEDVCDRIGILYGGRMQIEGQVKSLLQHTDKKQIVTGGISDAALEKIRQIVHSEQAKCDISSPMDKLEEFFIKIVAAAEEKNLPTSGALGISEIGGFLTEDADGQNVLDKLVSASLHDESVSVQTTDTEAVEPVESVLQPDDDMLEGLTKTGVEQSQTDTVEVTEPLEVHDGDAEQINQDVLEKLTGMEKKPDGSTEPARGEESGEIEDA